MIVSGGGTAPALSLRGLRKSFGAVVALIAVYETGLARRPAEAGGLDWRLLMYVGGIALTTL